MHKECRCKEFCSQTSLGGEICSADVNTHKGHYDFKASSCAQRKARGENGPCSSSPVTLFRARLCKKNEAPEEEADFRGFVTNDMVIFWRGYLKKGCVNVSTH